MKVVSNNTKKQQQQHKKVQAGTWEQHDKPTITSTAQRTTNISNVTNQQYDSQHNKLMASLTMC